MNPRSRTTGLLLGAALWFLGVLGAIHLSVTVSQLVIEAERAVLIAEAGR